MKRPSFSIALMAALAVAAALAQTPKTRLPSNAAAASAANKFDYLAKNSAQAKPDTKPTSITEEEINAYLAAQMVALPQGVHNARFSGEKGVVTANTSVNFDEVKEGRNSSNPLLGIFTGTHNVKVTANASGAGGRGTVHVQDVEIDGMAVPRLALEFFVDRFLKSKYPGIGLDSTFALPARIDSATVGKHVLTVRQK